MFVYRIGEVALIDQPEQYCRRLCGRRHRPRSVPRKASRYNGQFFLLRIRGPEGVDHGFSSLPKKQQLMIQDVARRIAQEKIAPSAEHHDKTGEVSAREHQAARRERADGD